MKSPSDPLVAFCEKIAGCSKCAEIPSVLLTPVPPNFGKERNSYKLAMVRGQPTFEDISGCFRIGSPHFPNKETEQLIYGMLDAWEIPQAELFLTHLQKCRTKHPTLKVLRKCADEYFTKEWGVPVPLWIIFGLGKTYKVFKEKITEGFIKRKVINDWLMIEDYKVGGKDRVVIFTCDPSFAITRGFKDEWDWLLRTTVHACMEQARHRNLSR